MNQRDDTGLPPGTIILPTSAQPRFWEFSDSVEHLIVPAGTRYVKAKGCDITRNLNLGIKRSIGEWVWFLGDDHAFRPDFLLKLLERGVDVVVPITPSKMAPWYPCVFHGPWSRAMKLYTWDELSEPGLMELSPPDLIGQAGMLVRKPVLDAMGYPWFRAGQFDPGQLTEDLDFCTRLHDAGVKIWLDRDAIFEHHMHYGITAIKYKGVYVPALRSGDTLVGLPQSGDFVPADLGTPVPAHRLAASAPPAEYVR